MSASLEKCKIQRLKSLCQLIGDDCYQWLPEKYVPESFVGAKYKDRRGAGETSTRMLKLPTGWRLGFLTKLEELNRAAHKDVQEAHRHIIAALSKRHDTRGGPAEVTLEDSKEAIKRIHSA